MNSTDPLAGKWTYRSWLNDPKPVVVTPPSKQCERLNAILFAEATLIIKSASGGELTGRLDMGTTGSLTLFGSVGYGSPFAVRFQGVGKDKGSPCFGWIYDYIGWLVPAWPDGIDQQPAIVGSVIRTVTHSDGKAKAGVVASFVAVKQGSS